MHYPSRIRTRAERMKNGKALLEIASSAEVRKEMLRRIDIGEKPVTALSKPMIEAFGQEANDYGLRRLAGEVTAYIVEKINQRVRSSGSRKIICDPLFASGQPFRRAAPAHNATAYTGTKMDSPELLVRYLSDENLNNLAHIITAERERRAGSS